MKHIHAMPAFINYSLSRPVHHPLLQCPTKLFSAFYSTLKTPISPPPSFETTPIASFLLNECGFSLHDANTIYMKRPDLFSYKSYDNARQTLFFLREKGVNEIGVLKLFSSCPTLLRSSFQDTVKPKVEFLEKIGLTGQKLLKALNKYPHIFRSGTCRALEPRVRFLQSVLDPDLATVASNTDSDKIAGTFVSNNSLAASVISQNPRILTMPLDNFLVRVVKDVEGMGIEKGSKAFARSFLQLSRLNRDTAKRKLENLRELGFTEEEVRILVRKLPTIVVSSKDTLRQKLKFLVEEWKLPRNAILSNPAVLSYSIEKRLKPRLNAVRALMMMNKSPEKAMSCHSAHYLKMSSGDFHRKVVSRLPVVTKENEANPL